MKITSTTVTKLVEQKVKVVVLELTIDELTLLKHFLLCSKSDMRKDACSLSVSGYPEGFQGVQQFADALNRSIELAKVF